MRKFIFVLLFVLCLSLALSSCANKKVQQKVQEQLEERTEVRQDGVIVTRDIPYASSILTTFDVYYKDGYEDAPVIVLVHGGYEPGNPDDDIETLGKGGRDKSGREDNAQMYLDLGFVVMAPNYRWSTAEFSKEHDVSCAIATFSLMENRFGADANNMVLQGGSGGAQTTSYMYFKQEHDWLQGCAVQTQLPDYKGLVLKSFFRIGTIIPEEIDVEYLPGGVKFYVTDEYIAHEDVQAQMDMMSDPIFRPPSDRHLGEITPEDRQGIQTLRDGAINHIDSNDGSVFIIHGDQDPRYDVTQTYIWFMEELDLHGVPYYHYVQAGGGHGVKIQDRPLLRQKVETYVLALVNDEPLPEIVQ